MKVSTEIQQQWKDLQERGDLDKISKIIGVSRENVSLILSTGKGSITQISCIQKFYKNRKKEIAKIENDLN